MQYSVWPKTNRATLHSCARLSLPDDLTMSAGGKAMKEDVESDI